MSMRQATRSKRAWHESLGAALHRRNSTTANTPQNDHSNFVHKPTSTAVAVPYRTVPARLSFRLFPTVCPRYRRRQSQQPITHRTFGPFSAAAIAVGRPLGRSFKDTLQRPVHRPVAAAISIRRPWQRSTNNSAKNRQSKK